MNPETKPDSSEPTIAPTEAEIAAAFEEPKPAEEPTESEIVAAFEEPVEPADEIDPKRKNLHDIIFSAVTSFLIVVIGLSLYSLIAYGSLQGITALLTANGSTQILSVTPTETANGILGNNSHFIVKTVNGSVDKLKNTLYLEPAIDYEIVERIAGAEYEVIPASTLADNTVFNVDSVKNGIASYKWAFQTKKALSVSKIYPANGASYVSENSVIEFNFSYPEVEGIESHFKISPAIDGSFTQTTRGWRFSPSTPLAANTTYEITITSGLTFGEEIMTEDFHSSFSTFSRAVTSSNEHDEYITLDTVSTFTENDTPVISIGAPNRAIFNDASYVEIEKLANADDFISHLAGHSVTGESLGAKDLRKVDGKTTSDTSSLVMNETLPTGYYIFRLKNAEGGNLLTANVQVNNLAAYAFESERDVVFWVAENGELKSGIKVNFKGSDYYTGDNGVLSLSNISNFSEQLDYAKIGNSDQPLVIGLTNFKNDVYPTGFIYSDRPLYKPTDTVKVWGYVPLSFFADSPNLNGFSLVLDQIKQPVTVNRDGTFSAEINLTSYKEIAYSAIQLVYNDAVIASRYIGIEDYTLENYIYEIIAPKNYVLAGENIEFKIKVSHITGFPASNKDLVLSYESKDYYVTTDAFGEVSVSFPTDASFMNYSTTSPHESKNISVNSAGAEYNKYSTGKSFYVFRTNLDLEKTIDDSNTLTLTAKSLDLSTAGEFNYSNSNMVSVPYSGNVRIVVTEEAQTRHISSYYYNEYTKENTPQYSYSYSRNTLRDETVSISDGTGAFALPSEYKEAEGDTRYNYYYQITATDTLGRPYVSYESCYHWGTFVGETSYNGYSRNAIDVGWGYYSYRRSLDGLSGDYGLYRFGYKDMNGRSPYSLGDSLSLGLYGIDGESVANNGQALAIAYKEHIITTHVFNTNTLNLAFDQNLYPGAVIVGAYYEGGKFYRVAPTYNDYRESDSELTVKVETEHGSYEPGGTVRAKVIITRADGSRVNSGKVNLSVVNEAIFNSMTDDTNILSRIYANKYYKGYSMSTFRDYDLGTSGGGMGAAGGFRSNFGDTVYFAEKTFTNGEADFEFKLNDSITSFRLTAIAVEPADLIAAGAGTRTISSALPLSLSTVMPKHVKNTDDLVLNATSPVSGSETINYTFRIEELDRTIDVAGRIGETVYANFGKLDLGKYTVTISGRDGAGNEDGIKYDLEIVDTAQEVAVKKTVSLGDTASITPVKSPIVLEIYNAEAKKYLDYLEKLSGNLTARLDTQIAYYKALALRNTFYDESNSLTAPSFGDYLASDGRLRSLVNAEGDYVLTALANYYAPDYFDLKATNYAVEIDDDLSTTLEKLLVLASFKEPVLLDLQAAQHRGVASAEELTGRDRIILGLAYAFLGDYDAAKSANAAFEEALTSTDTTDLDLLAVLATFINKSKAETLIDQTLASQPAADYLDFAILSFFENNEANLITKNVVKITTTDSVENVELNGLKIEKRTFFLSDLTDLRFDASSKDAYATYYYQGRLSELAEFSTDLTARLEGDTHLGGTAYLVIDISNLQGDDRNGELNLALPSALKFSATFAGSDGLYLSRNNNEYIKLNLTSRYTSNEIRIPLYIAAPGNYELEPVIFIHDGAYHLSNNFDVALSK